jgi:hypothetical protein
MSGTEEQLEIILDEPKENKPEKADEPVVLVEDEEGKVPELAADQKNENDPEEIIKKLEKTLKKERKAREKAERRVDMAAQQVRAAYTEVGDTNKQLVASAIERLKTENDILTSTYAEAMQVGDYDKAARIQADMTANSTKLVQMENGYQEMQRNPPRIPEIPEPPKSDDVLDQIIESVSKDSARWLKANRDHLDNEKMIRRMFRAHEDAVEDGVIPDTPQYFRFIEEQETVMSSASRPASKAPPPAAPVERYNNSRTNVVRLTRAEADMASVLGMTEKEYAIHKRELQKQGKLSN